MNKSQKGFTLIELLVVVAIIGILSGIAFVSISGARESAYDTQIQSELSQIRSNAEQHYYDQGGTYGPDVDGAQSYYDSDGWVRIATEIPPCSIALLDVDNAYGDDSGAHEDLTQESVYQISVGNQAYAAWAPLCAATEDEDNPVYYCIDSDGNAGEYEGHPGADEETDCDSVFGGE